MSLLPTPSEPSAVGAAALPHIADHDDIVLPAMPKQAERTPFPLIASAAPIVAACVIWAITQSPFVLLFAALGPVVAVAGMLDGKRQNARRAKREGVRFRTELDKARGDIAQYHYQERAEAWATNPAALGAREAQLDAETVGLWRNAGLSTLTVGRGPVPSAVGLDTAALNGSNSGEQNESIARARDELMEVRRQARVLLDAPVLASAGDGIAIVGAARLAHAVLRGFVLQLARACQPMTVRLRFPEGDEWAWAQELPHSSNQIVRDAVSVQIVDRSNKGAVDNGRASASASASATGERGATMPGVVLFVIAESIEQVPPECSTVLCLDSPRAATVIRSSRRGRTSSIGITVIPELVGREQAGAVAQRLARRAEQTGFVQREQALPSSVALHEVPGYGTASAGLSCVIGVAVHGSVEVDLVAQGPHAVVGGTTGSGKSELLVSWVVSMAAAHSPADFSVLLVDFKGGAAFSGLEALPHCVGVLTDLDEHEATRALASLRAELRAREEQLRSACARSIDELSGEFRMPRLVIVVDEFAAMLGSFPELHELFVDIAARGRSLGVHLVLCTQRPAGVVRDALLANCSLRVSLRVNNEADSRATMGTDAAALISPHLPGRAFVDPGDGNVTEFHSAVAQTARLVGEIGDAFISSRHGANLARLPRRPWLPPLPATCALGDPELVEAAAEELPGTGTGASPLCFTLGLLDDPDRQRRLAARWCPETHGPLLVLGAARTGRTAVLDALHEQATAHGVEVTRCVSARAEEYWDTLVELSHAGQNAPENDAADVVNDPAPLETQSSQRRAERLILLDEWDAVIARWPTDYQLAATELLATALRASAAHGIHIALVADGITGAVQSTRAQWDAIVLLRLTEKSEHMRAGGTAAHWPTKMRPGRGEWRGLELHCALPSTAYQAPKPDLLSAATGATVDRVLAIDDGILIVVSTRPAQTLSALRARADAASVDPRVRVLDLAAVAPGGMPDMTPGVPGGFASGTAQAGSAFGNEQQHDAGSPIANDRHTESIVIVGDPDAWQARWGLFTSMRPQARLAFDACRLADYRAFSRQRELPPLTLAPISGGITAQTRVWAIDRDGRVVRARLR